jgi:hypothetical protein
LEKKNNEIKLMELEFKKNESNLKNTINSLENDLTVIKNMESKKLKSKEEVKFTIFKNTKSNENNNNKSNENNKDLKFNELLKFDPLLCFKKAITEIVILYKKSIDNNIEIEGFFFILMIIFINIKILYKL